MTDRDGITPIQDAPRPAGELANRRLGWGSYLAVCAAGLTLALTWLGPRAADGLGTLNAMAFWAVHVVPALALLASTQSALARIRTVAALPGLAQVVLTGVTASILFTPVALAIDAVFAGSGADRDDGGDALLPMAAAEFVQLVVPVVLTWSLINAPSLLAIEGREPNGHPRRVVAPTSPEPLPAVGAFWLRVPRRLGRDLVALSAELHYLRVHTTSGEALILFPFGQAVEAVSGLDGMRVHRSHWVALDHVASVATRDGRVVCDMAGGPSLPVSRPYRSALKAALRERAAAGPVTGGAPGMSAPATD